MIEEGINFFGRQSILDLLKRRVVDLKEGYRQNIAFLGQRFIGKSSILNKFLRDLDDDEIVDIYIDLENKDFDYLFTKFVGSLLYNFSKTKKLELHDDLNLLMENTRRLIPQTVSVIKHIQSEMTKGRFQEVYRGLITLPEIFTIESKKRCVIILDEFQHLEALGIENVFAELGKKIMTQKKCLYIVSSSIPSSAKKILSEKLSLLFGNFEIVQTTPFDLKTSQEFIEHNLGRTKIGIQLRNFLTDFTGGHPLYLDIISQELVHLAAVHRQEEVFMPLLTQAIENVIFREWGVLNRHFEIIVDQLTTGKHNRMNAGIMLELSNGKHKVKEMVEVLKVKPNFLVQRINRLIDNGIIVKNGNFYQFQDKLLKYWVKYVFQRRLKAVHEDRFKQKKQFKEELNRSINEFNVLARKNLSARIVELLHCFDNEAFDINGRRYKLPFFREITPLTGDSEAASPFDVICAYCSEGVWMIALKKETLCENDINMFLTRSKTLKEKPRKRVIISLSELDANARLKALQERMWIWSEKELNTLLNLYDKPYIVK